MRAVVLSVFVGLVYTASLQADEFVITEGHTTGPPIVAWDDPDEVPPEPSFVEVEEEVQPPPAKVPTNGGKDYFVLFTGYTEEDSAMTAVTVPELQAAGYTVRVINNSKTPGWGVTETPELWLANKEQQLAKWPGFVSADQVLKSLPASKPVAAVSTTTATGNPVMTTVTERYLVSELWCPACPAAKRRFLASGGRPENILTRAQALQQLGINVGGIPFEYSRQVQVPVKAQHTSPPQSIQVQQPQAQTYQRLPVMQTPWGMIDMETYSNPNCNCPMCVWIRATQQQLRSQQSNSSVVPPPQLPAMQRAAVVDFSQIDTSLPAGQQPTPADVVTKMVRLLQLYPVDVLADLGCGDARILIEAAKQYDCFGIGVELDPVRAATARRCVAEAGLAHKIEIITGDILEFDPAKYGVTAVTAYLFPELLAKLSDKFSTARVVASPYHEIPSLPMMRLGDVWIYRRAPAVSTYLPRRQFHAASCMQLLV